MERGCLGVVAAMPQEIAPLLRHVKVYKRERAAGFALYRFAVQGAPVLLIESGMGPAHAKAATETLISVAKPAVILNFGFAGGVLPGTEVGELVLAERVLWLEQGRLTQAPQPDHELAAILREACAGAQLTLKPGTFITTAAIMNKTQVAQSLEAGVPHPVLEMETAAVLRVAGEAGIPVLAVRGVSDAAHEELGFSIEEFCDRELRISPARILRCIAGKPWIIPQLVRLSGNSKKAGENLARCVEVALKALGSR
ncbi:MAG: nucleoside phosphorylase [Geobacteraceae bacterium GWC2_58_44]|nr:MAG: nucleoside phosphorylase [Geobacteraceae bacterium GWC2_58_44]HBG08340.1 nucleoside phosphorylase [Geobacter sp.]